MAAQNGRTLRLKKGDGASPEVFTTIAAAQETSMSSEVGEIDITDQDDAGYKTLLEGGIKSLSISISGVTKAQTLLQAHLAGTISNWQLEYEDTGDTITGAFQIGSYSDTGANENAAIMFKADLRSSGFFELETV